MGSRTSGAYHHVVSTVAALLLFPLRPQESLERIDRLAPPLLFLPLPAAAAGAALWWDGCAGSDALATAAAVLLTLLTTTLAGFGASWGASRISEADMPARRRLAGTALLTAWGAFLWALLSIFAGAFGIGQEGPLLAALIVLLWGLAAGIAVVGGPRIPEVARGWVASCTGMLGALAGLFLGALVATQSLVLAVPPPPASEDFGHSSLLLVRIDERPTPATVVLARNPETGRAVMARVVPGDGTQDTVLTPLTGTRHPPGSLAKLTIRGRVFYGIGYGAVPGAPE